jgi:hypothetical protein
VAEFEVSGRQRRDLREIYDWIAHDDPAAADRVLSDLRDAIVRLSRPPNITHDGSASDDRFVERGIGGDMHANQVGDDEALLDRAAGVLVGLAAGDALGAPYEFTVPGPGADIVMRAGGPWELGEWTDDTAQAVGIAEVVATGTIDLHRIGQRFLDWFQGEPKDVGISTAAVLRAAGRPDRLADAAADYFAAHPRGAAGNGSLMRTAPVALACLGDDAAIAEHARAVSLGSMRSHGCSCTTIVGTLSPPGPEGWCRAP